MKVNVGAFLEWWRAELVGMLPDALRRRYTRRRDAILISPSNGEALVSRRRNGRLEEIDRFNMNLVDEKERVATHLGRLKSSVTRVEVAVPAEGTLSKQVLLPLAAEENLREVLKFEMPRQTPFLAEQVYCNYRITGRRTQSQQIAVNLSVVPKAAVEPFLAPFADWKLEPIDDAVKTEQEDDLFVFVPSDGEHRSHSKTNRTLLTVNALLLAAAVAIPLMQQHHHLGKLRARLDGVRASAATASDLQQRLDEQQAQAEFLFAQKSARPATVDLLEELSRRLPDDTWLFRLEVRNGKVQVQGTSATASTLIGELEGSRFLEDVRFASPVTRDGDSGRERFHLSAKVLAPPRPVLAGSSEGGDT